MKSTKSAKNMRDCLKITNIIGCGLRVTGMGGGDEKTHVSPCVCKAKVAKITLCACVCMKRIRRICVNENFFVSLLAFFANTLAGAQVTVKSNGRQKGVEAKKQNKLNNKINN